MSPDPGPREGDGEEHPVQRRLALLDRRDDLETRLKGFRRLPPASWVVWPLTAVGAAGVAWWGWTRGEWAEAVFVALLLVVLIGGYYTLLAFGIGQTERELREIEREIERLDAAR